MSEGQAFGEHRTICRSGGSTHFSGLVMPFEADKKEQKGTARQMINMVTAMNQTTLKKTPIDCFTCHQFRNRPLLRPHFADEWTRQHSVESHDPTTLVNGTEPKSPASTGN